MVVLVGFEFAFDGLREGKMAGLSGGEQVAGEVFDVGEGESDRIEHL